MKRKVVQQSVRWSTLLLVLALIFGLASSSQAATVVTVTPGTANWFLVDDNGVGGGGAAFVRGPGLPFAGEGSVNMFLNTAGAGYMLASSLYNGTPLSNITSLSYSTYRSSVNAGNILAIALAFNVDFNGTDGDVSWQGRLVYEPYHTPGNTVPQNTWQTWSPLSGRWFATRAPFNGVCPMANPCTWAQVLSNWPNAAVHATQGAVVLKAGSNWAGFNGAVDALLIGVSGSETLYDFEGPGDVYVNGAWSAVAPGADPDGAGPATAMGADAFVTVQGGVNAVRTGSVVHIAAGTYVEQVEVARNMTLQGAGASTIIKSPATLPVSYMPGTIANKAVLYVHNANNVVVEDLLLDGDGKGNLNYRFQGIGYWNAGGRIDNVDIINVIDSPFSGAQHGVALYAYNSDGAPRSIEVANCNIDNFQKNGMALGGVGLTVNVHDCVVTGAGPTGVTAQNGIQVAFGATGVINDNTISNISWTGADWVASGVLVYGPASVDSSGNTITNVQAGIYYYDSIGTIDGNTISTTAAGVGTSNYTGIYASDPPGRLPVPLSEAETQPQTLGRGLMGTTAVDTVVVSNNTITGGSDSPDSIGIEARAGYSANALDFTATGNAVSGWGAGLGLFQCAGTCPGPGFAAYSVSFNNFSGNTYGVSTDGLPATAQLGFNYWGCAGGLGAAGCGLADGDVDGSPWLAEAYVPGHGQFIFPAGVDDGADFAALMAAGPQPGDTIVLLPGVHNPTGGYNVTQPGLNILATGATLLPSSPCFTLSASDTYITGGLCTPSGSDPGIVTDAAVNNIAIIGMEITGGTGDGIQINHAINNLQIVDNYIHANGGDGVEYAAVVTGVHDVMGNLFANNGGMGINNTTGVTYRVEYNSWGAQAGPAAGDGISGALDADPYTHVSTDMVSSGSPVADRVAIGSTIVYTVRMDATEAYGADFELDFDETRLTVTALTAAATFPQHVGACDLSSVATANTDGKIKFCGFSHTAVTGTALPVFTVTFQGTASGLALLDFVDTTDLFSMAPPYGASNNIYAYLLTDKTVEVFPALNVTALIDLQGRANNGGALVSFEPGAAQGYGPYAFTPSDYWGNAGANGVVQDTYIITVSMPRYLDVTIASNRSVAISPLKLALNLLMLWAGDANDDGVISTLDAGIIGAQYGLQGVLITNVAADINNDGKVNVLDLALMGGNFTRTSASDYSTWTP